MICKAGSCDSQGFHPARQKAAFDISARRAGIRPAQHGCTSHGEDALLAEALSFRKDGLSSGYTMRALRTTGQLIVVMAIKAGDSAMS
jgi:hypothetical protein